MTLTHTSRITALSFSPDGSRLASAAADSSIRLWQIPDGAPLRVLSKIEDTWLTTLYFVDDHTLGWVYPTTHFTNLDTDQTTAVPGQLAPIPAGKAVRWAEWLYDGEYLLDEQRKRQKPLEWPRGRMPIRRLRVSPGGGLVAAHLGEFNLGAGGFDMYVAVAAWRTNDERPVAAVFNTVWPVQDVVPASDELLVLALLDPTSTLIRQHVKLSVASVKAGPRRDFAELTDNVTGLAVSGDGTSVAASFGGHVAMWRVADGAPLWQYDFDELTTAVSVSPDGRWVAVGLSSGRIVLFEDEGGRLVGEPGSPVRRARRVLFKDADQLVATSAAYVSVWNLSSGAQVRHHSYSSPTVGFGLLGDDLMVLREIDGACHAATGEHSVAILPERWRGLAPPPDPDQAHKRSYRDQALPTHPARWPPRDIDEPFCVPGIFGIVGSAPAAGEWVLARGTFEKPIYFSHRIRDGAEKQLAAGSDYPRLKVSKLSADGNWFIGYLYGDKLGSALRVWDTRTGAPVLEDFTIKETDVEGSSVAIAHDGTQAALALNKHLYLYQLPSGAHQVIDLPTAIGEVAFLERDRLVVGGRNGELYLTDGARAARVGDTSGGSVQSIAVAPGGGRIATISDDGLVRVWGVTSNLSATLQATLVEFADDEWILTAPDGSYVGSTEAAEHVGWVFDAPLEYFRFEQFASTYQSAAAVTRALAGTIGSQPAVMRPPRLTLVGPPRVQHGATAGLRVRVSSATRIERVDAFVEGRPVVSHLVCRADAEVALAVPLRANRNRITLVAVDDHDLASNPVAVDVTAPTQQPPALWLISVGINSYPKLASDRQLHAAENDARSIAEVFGALAGDGRPFSKPREPNIITGAAADAVSIQAALGELASMRPNDLAVVYLAGHGWRRADGSMVFLTGGVGKVGDLPHAAVSWDAIASSLSAARGRVLLLLDACHAGDFSTEVVQNGELAHKLVSEQRAGVVVFAASKGRQPSIEGEGGVRGVNLADDASRAGAAPSNNDAGSGLFASAVVAALRDPAADHNHDGVVSLFEFVDEVTRRVTRATHGKQVPWIARRELFGDFALAPRFSWRH